MCRWKRWAVVLVLSGLVGGCTLDAGSARRIALRRQHFAARVADLQAREAAAPARLEQRRKDLRRWWDREVRDFRARLAGIGDDLL